MLVGRDRELHELGTVLDDLLAGRGGLVLVAGEAGMGKTSLVDAFAAEASNAGARVLAGPSSSAEDAPPLLPWSRVVRAWLRAPESSQSGVASGSVPAPLRRLVPDVFAAVDASAASSDVPLELSASHHERWSLFEAAASLVSAAATVAPIVIVLDDLHDADVASVELLRFLAPQLRTQRVLVAATARVEDLPETHADALANVASSSMHLELHGLDRPTLSQLVHELTGVAASDVVVGRLHDHTGGNPFFAREVLRLLVSEGHLDDVATLPLPGSVQAVLRRRLRGLGSPCQRMLSVAAVAGDESPIALLVTVSGLDQQSVLDAIDEAVAARLVVSDSPGQCRFAHALVRATVSESLDAAARRELHQRIGEALETTAANGASVAQLAHHFIAALPRGDAAKAAGYAAEAARQASELLAHEDAARHYRDALAALDLDGGPSASRRIPLLLALGGAESRAGSPSAAAETFRSAADLARSTRDGPALGQAALGLGGRIETGRADPALIAVLDEALDAVAGADDGLEARVMARLAHALLFTSATERRQELAVRALGIARRSGDRAALASALYVWHIVGWTPTNLDERLAAAHELCALGERPRDREFAMLGHHLLAYDHAEHGDMGAMERELSIGAQLADQLREPLWQWISQMRSGMRAVMRGRFVEGEQIITDALASGSQVAPELALLLFGSALVPLRRWQGRLGELEQSFRAYIDAYPELPEPRCVLAVANAEDGHVDAARAEFEVVMAGGPDSFASHSSWVITVAALAYVAASLGDKPRAALLYELLLPMQGGAVMGPFAEACYGSADLFLALVAEARGDEQRARRHFEKAVARNREMGARPAQAETQFHYARFLSEHGDESLAAAVLDEARRAFAELEMTTYATRADEVSARLAQGAPAPPAVSENVFRRDGSVWRVAFAGHAAFVDDSKGMHDLAYLLSRPGREVHVLDLVAQPAAGRAATRDRRRLDAATVTGRGDELLDERARRAYKARIVELDEELTEADEFGDPERAARARAERDALTDELVRALGLGGRARRGPDAGERARQAVRARVRDAIRRLHRVHPKLARHLERSVRTGYFCCYEPEEAVAWRL